MSVLLIYPPMGIDTERYADSCLLPECICRLTSFLQKKGIYAHQVSLDAKMKLSNIKGDQFLSNILKRPWFKNADIFCFSIVDSYQLLQALKIAKKIKNDAPNKKIILGGNIMGFLDTIKLLDDYKHIINYVIKGEGECGLVQLIKHLERDDNRNDLKSIPGLVYFSFGKIMQNPTKSLDCNTFTPPTYEGMIDDYKKLARKKNIDLISCYQIIKGCNNRCKFCDFHNFSKPSFRPIKTVVKDVLRIRNRYGVNTFWFVCNAINLDKVYLEKLCDALSAFNPKIRWMTHIIPKNMPPSLLVKMKKAGCYTLNYGIESGSQKVLKSMNKSCNLNEVEEVLKNAKESGIINFASFILNSPHENLRDKIKTIKFIIKNKNYIDSIVFYRFSFSKNSIFYNDYEPLKKFFIHWRKNNIFLVLSFITLFDILRHKHKFILPVGHRNFFAFFFHNKDSKSNKSLLDYNCKFYLIPLLLSLYNNIIVYSKHELEMFILKKQI